MRRAPFSGFHEQVGERVPEGAEKQRGFRAPPRSRATCHHCERRTPSPSNRGGTRFGVAVGGMRDPPAPGVIPAIAGSTGGTETVRRHPASATSRTTKVAAVDVAQRRCGRSVDGWRHRRRTAWCGSTRPSRSAGALQLLGRWSDLRMVERYSQALDAGPLHWRYSPATMLGLGGDELQM